VVVAVVLAGIVASVALGVYGRWAGWGFGLAWWGRPTPARVRAVTPLRGAAMAGHSEQSLAEQAHRVLLDLTVEPSGADPYEATAIAWQAAGDHLSGRTLVARVSRTRPTRVHVPRNASAVPQPEGGY
jgi:hypothetical protein